MGDQHSHDYAAHNVALYQGDKAIRISEHMLRNMSPADYAKWREQVFPTTTELVQTAYDRTLEFSLRPAFEGYRKAIAEGGGALGEDRYDLPESKIFA